MALFALALQLAFSFGHIHAQAFRSQAVNGALTVASTLDGDASRQPGGSHPSSDVFCDICATLTLTATAQISVAPVLAARSFVVLAPESVSSDAAPIQRRYLLAQSRAPPAV